MIVVSDLHCGCRVAICGKDPVQLDDGGTYMPSPMQLKLNSWWEEFWGEWVPEATGGEPFCVAINGDVVDGSHHNTVTQISQNLADQQSIAVKLLSPVRDLCDGRFYMIRGTEAHVGQSGQNEEKIARELGAIAGENGQRARWDLWKKIGDDKRGGLVHLAHHIGTAGSSAYESSAPQRELAEAFVESGRWGEEAPRVILRAHRHRYIQNRVAGRDGEYIVAVSPAWQLKTPLAYKIMGGRQSQPQIGGLMVRFHKGELFVRPFVRGISRSKEE